MAAAKKQYRVINTSGRVVFVGDYCAAMDEVIKAKNAVIVSVIGLWVIAKSVRGVFSVIDEPFKHTPRGPVLRRYVATFTALDSFYGAGNMAAGETCTAITYGKDRAHAMRNARQNWRDTNGGPHGIRAKISVRLQNND